MKLPSIDLSHYNPVPPGLLESAWSLVAPAQFESAKPHGTEWYANPRISWGTQPRADVYLPDGPGPHPSVLLCHGGAFVVGSRNMKPMRFLATRLAAAGYAAVPFDYRLLLRGGMLQEMIDDVDAVHRWWLRQKDVYNLDLDRVAMAGLSAGAALALLHASMPPLPPLSHVVCFFGIYHFGQIEGPSGSWVPRLLLDTSDRQVWAERSPFGNCGTPFPLLLLHGGLDRLTPVEQAYDVVAERRNRGLETSLKIFESAPHAFLNDLRRPEAEEGVTALLEFLSTSKV
ncbi:MAG: hypothetical protein A2289_16845 [Deltaproteobacteria bacterium RIFOXYA12_FULL_58_15]|nr:MAG: hypothetical protein A2289_16845 [Deltaproteobacteria bacterium RIFOXYA12_FULL_58_15]OGR10298.1 MAG: hypothetical protein A2341_16875 [Deltaproteobacteria bacterium RIFOXYB12_FULL_58_9]